MASTIYDIQVRFSDRGGFNRTGRAAQSAARRIGILERSIRSAGTALLAGGAFFGVKAAKNALIDFNTNLEQARLSMSGLLQMNMGGEWADNQERANRLVRQFQNDAKKSVATTMDFVDMGKLITGPLTRVGGTLKDVSDITKGAVVAAKAMGEESGLVARDIEAALRGNITMRDRFIRAMLPTIKMTKEEFNTIARQAPEQALGLLRAMFGAEAIKNMAETQAKSFAGVSSTLRDNIERMFGRIGLPLMNALTEQMARINAFFDNNSTKVAQFVNDFSAGLVKGFNLAVKAFEFINRNRALLLSLAKSFLIFKAVRGVGGILTGMAGGLSSLNTAAVAASGGLSGLSGKLGAFTSALGPATMALGAFAGGLNVIADWIDREQSKRLEARTRPAGNVDFFGRFGQNRLTPSPEELNTSRTTGLTPASVQAKSLLKTAISEGLIKVNKGGEAQEDIPGILKKFALQTLNPSVANRLSSAKSIDELRSKVDSLVAEARQPRTSLADRDFDTIDFANKTADKLTRLLDGLERTLSLENARRPFEVPTVEEFAPRRKNTSNNQNVEVTIHRIEVASDDPDRFAFGLVESFNSVARNPTQAANPLPEI